MSIDKILKMRPQNVINKLGKNSKLLLLSSRDIFEAIYDLPLSIMACNTRVKWVIPGIMRAAKEFSAVVGFELARTECNLEGGYTGFTPYTFFETVVEFAERENFYLPFFIHADHTTVRNTSKEEIEYARKLLQACYDAGYTSFAIDASHNPLPENMEITLELGMQIDREGLGLEVEVGEITSSGENAKITEVSEAIEYISFLKGNGLTPDLLAINNGSKHGNYKEGETVFIDLERTKEVAEALRRWNVGIAQHGTTGTPNEIIAKFPFYGIKKVNVGTLWQNIAHSNLPPELFNRMKEWAEANRKDIKYANKEFKNEIDSINRNYQNKIIEEAKKEAVKLIKLLNCAGSSNIILERLG
ncbi:MAG: class II fructose-bisphosphate aldolase [Candidatus Aminicenantia bacterium]